MTTFTDGVWQALPTLDGHSLDYTRDVYFDAWQRLWICCGDGLLCLDGNVCSFYPESLFAQYSISLKSVVLDADQNVWIRLMDTHSPQSLVKFDTVTATRYPACELPLPSPYVQSIFSGQDGKLWIATSYGDGIGGYMSIDADEVETFGTYNTDMPCDHVWALEQDALLNMWVSSCLALVRTGPSGTQVFNSNQTGISIYDLYTICAVGDGVWIGGNEGVSRYQNGSWSVLTAAEAGLNLGNTRSIEKDPDGNVWIACASGVLRYRNGLFTIYPQLANAKDLAFGPDAKVWIARGQLSSLQNGSINHYNADNSGLYENHVACVAVDNNQHVWAGSSYPDCVLYCLAEGQWTAFSPNNSPLTGSAISRLYVDDDNTKWIGGMNLTVFNEAGIPTGSDDQLAPPLASAANYPNPFVSGTTIRYTQQAAGPVRVNIYNIRGQKVWSKQIATQSKGAHELAWDGKDSRGKDCSAGIYLIEVADRQGRGLHKALKLK